MSENCAVCRYVGSQTNHRFIEDKGLTDVLEACCRRKAPVFAQGNGNTYFPDTTADNWCGEFERERITS